MPVDQGTTVNDQGVTQAPSGATTPGGPSLTEIGMFLKHCDPRLVCEYLDDDVNMRVAIGVHLETATIAPAEAKGPAPAMPNGVEGLDLIWLNRILLRVSTAASDVETQSKAREQAAAIRRARKSLRAADNRDATGVDADEDAYVIERMGKLLAEIAVIVNGPEPALTRWSYHDLPDKVRALKEAPTAAPAGEAVAWRFYIEDHPDLKPYWTGWGVDEWFRDQMVKRGCRAEYARPVAAEVREVDRLREALEEIVSLNGTESDEWDAVERVIPEMVAAAKAALSPPGRAEGEGS